LERLPVRCHEDMRQANLTYAPVILDTIKTNASGRPGPNVVTGAYRDSIRVVEVGETSLAFGSDAPQAWRLEKGFVGMDSLGREYAQPPYPHFGPAIRYWKRPWARALARASYRSLVNPNG
jgi:hypothetical protein